MTPDSWRRQKKKKKKWNNFGVLILKPAGREGNTGNKIGQQIVITESSSREANNY